MSMELLQDVYNLDPEATSQIEQAALAALAFHANPKNNLKCFPSRKRIAQMTHLSSGGITDALNGLRGKGYIDWKTGGWSGGRKATGGLYTNDYWINWDLIRKNAMKPKKKSAKPSKQDMPPAVDTTCPPVGHSASTGVYTSEHQVSTAVDTTCPLVEHQVSTAVDTTCPQTINNITKIEPLIEPKGDQPHQSMSTVLVGEKKEGEVSPEKKPAQLALEALKVCGYVIKTKEYNHAYLFFGLVTRMMKPDEAEAKIKAFKAEPGSRTITDANRNLVALELLKRLGASDENLARFNEGKVPNFFT